MVVNAVGTASVESTNVCHVIGSIEVEYPGTLGMQSSSAGSAIKGSIKDCFGF